MSNAPRQKSASPILHSKPIHLRLTEEDLVKTHSLAQNEGRSATNFARFIFLRALAQYEAAQAQKA